jgi:hypothetical protein
MLGIGLHSYGFMDAAFRWLLLAAGLCLLLITICTFPTSVWKSFATNDANKGIRQAVGIGALVLASIHVFRVAIAQRSGEYIFYVEIGIWALMLLVTLIISIIRRFDAQAALRAKREQPAV